MPATPLLSPSEFVALEGIAHLCTGGEAPWLRSHDDACRRFGVLKSAGMTGRDAMFDLQARVKQRVATLLGLRGESASPAASRVATLAHTSEGLNQAVAAVDWRPGDNAVVADVEFPSLVFPLTRLRALGVEPRIVRARDHYVSTDDVAAAVDGRTRLLLASHVSYLTGQRIDLARYAEIAHVRGAWLAVDATHALGIAPVDGELCDFVVSACYKWLLATHGVGLFACRTERVGPLQPRQLGWHSVSQREGAHDPLAVDLRPNAGRLEAGNPSLLGLFVLDSALDTVMRFDQGAVLAHALELGSAVIGGLEARGYRVITPRAPEERAGNICFLSDAAPALVARLAERGVLVWGSEGRVRVSVHLYNRDEDVTRFFAALDAAA